RVPGHYWHLRTRRSVRAPSETQSGVRGSRRRMGTPLHVPDGSCLRPASLLAAGRDPEQDAERVLLRERVHDLSGRLGRIQDEGYVQRPPPDVGERLSAQRLDLAVVAGSAEEAHRELKRAGTQLYPARQRLGVVPAGDLKRCRDRGTGPGELLLTPAFAFPTSSRTT